MTDMTPVDVTLARSKRCDISTDGGTTWLQIYGINDFNDEIDPTMADASDYATDGWASSVKTLQGWKLTLKANRKRAADEGAEDPAFVALRAARLSFGAAGKVSVRWGRTDGLEEAYQGRADVAMSPSKTGVADLDEWQIELTGDGKAEAITVPTEWTTEGGGGSGE